jgi:phosphomevalonate kinase
VNEIHNIARFQYCLRKSQELRILEKVKTELNKKKNVFPSPSHLPISLFRLLMENANNNASTINSITDTIQLSSPPPPAPVAHRQLLNDAQFNSQPMSATHQLQQQQKQESEIQAALKDIRTSLQRSKVMNANNSPTPLFNTNNASNMMNNNSGYYDRTPVIPEKVESPAMSLSPVWIPR